jgi:membrane protein
MIDRARRLIGSADRWTMRHRSTRISRRAVQGFLAHEGLQYAGTMAYFAVLSLFQLLVLAIVIGSFFLGEGTARDFVIDQVQAGTPLDAGTVAAIIDGAIESRGSMTVVSFAFLTWAGLGIFSAVSNGIGRVFSQAPRRSFLREKLLGLLLMLLTGALAIAALVIGIGTGVLQSAAGELLEGVPGAEMAVQLIGLLAPMALIFMAFWFIYRIVPNRRVGWLGVLPGAVAATLLWTVLRFGFTWYATSIARYDTAFGPISTAVTLLVFLYLRRRDPPDRGGDRARECARCDPRAPVRGAGTLADRRGGTPSGRAAAAKRASRRRQAGRRGARRHRHRPLHETGRVLGPMPRVLDAL